MDANQAAFQGTREASPEEIRATWTANSEASCQNMLVSATGYPFLSAEAVITTPYPISDEQGTTDEGCKTFPDGADDVEMEADFTKAEHSFGDEAAGSGSGTGAAACHQEPPAPYFFRGVEDETMISVGEPVASERLDESAERRDSFSSLMDWPPVDQSHEKKGEDNAKE